MKTWKLSVNEDELKALIAFHSAEHCNHANSSTNPDVDRSARIHDLTKRLNRETPEVDNSNQNENQQAASTANEPAPQQDWK